MTNETIALGSLLVFAAVVGCRSNAPTASGSTQSGSSAHTLDGLFKVEGGEMHLHCVGSGSPVVVFDSALGESGLEWKQVAPEIARSTRACVYDRKGVGYSAPPKTKPHSTRQMADELHALLDRASLRGPLVLVGHSIGGVTMRIYASTHPDEIAGMVLVESADDPLVLWSLMPKEATEQRRDQLAKSPEGLDLDAFVAGTKEMHTLSKPLGDKPLVVLTRGKADAPPSASPEIAQEWFARWKRQQAELLSLSTNSVQVFARDNGHMMPVEAPAFVVTAVREVLTAVSSHGRVRESAFLSLANQPKGS
jgi:pimeloyl-ACP methyl ester carboxylesterase